jgi:hypothetical protein
MIIIITQKKWKWKTVYKIKISSDALKCYFHWWWTNPNISQHKVLLNSFIGSTMGLVRGYMFANKTETIKEKAH